MSKKSTVIMLFFATLICSHVTAFSVHYWFWWVMLALTGAFGWLFFLSIDDWHREKYGNNSEDRND